MSVQPDPILVYNGTTYRFTRPVAADLLDRGVILPDPSGETDYRLSLEHTIDEIEDLAAVLSRADAPAAPRLRVFDRNGGLFGGRGPMRRLLYIFRDDKHR
jgi:hypothetical protein